MSLTRKALSNPSGAAVAIAMILFGGLYCLGRLPLQLFPDIDPPQITIFTSWRGASPFEVESELVEPIEEVLRGVGGVKEMSSQANPGGANIELFFDVGADMQAAMIDVISRMNRLPALPRDASPPTVTQGGWDGTAPTLTWFFLQVLPDNTEPVESYAPFVNDVIKPRLEAIPGVAAVALGGGRDVGEQDLVIAFDPVQVARLGIQIPAIERALAQSRDLPAGFLDVSRRRYTLRFAGKYDPSELDELVLEWRNGQPVRLGDIASITVEHRNVFNLGRQNGNPALGIRLTRENGANVLATLSRVKAEVEVLRTDLLRPQGLDMQQSFDPSVFIYRAISLVSGNLLAGMLLSTALLWLFLRRLRATLIVAIAIPISLLGTFIILKLSGRSLNVISLAGLAFAVGMVLDAAIVVLENIIQLRERGMALGRAALEGAVSVWGALLASTITTVAIFVPVVFLEDVEGQLFGDLALTISIAVTLSLLVAMAVVPIAARTWLARETIVDHHARIWDGLTGWIMRQTATARRRIAISATLLTVPVVLTWLWLPELDYLPPVKRDAVDSFFQLPPATNLDTIRTDVIGTLESRLAPYMAGEREPALKNYYILIWPNGGTMGVRAKDQSKVGELERLIREEITVGIPDFMAFTSQGNLFGGFGGDRNIPLGIQSRDSAQRRQLARDAQGWLAQALPDAQIRVEPGLDQAEPELRVLPDDRALHEHLWTREELGMVTRTLGSGLYVGDYFDGQKRLDIVLRAMPSDSPDALDSLALVTADGETVPFSSLAAIQRTVGPEQILRIDGKRTTNLIISPPETMSLERALEIIRTEVEPRIQAALPADGSLHYGGSADSLGQALQTMGSNFLVAVGILFLLMAALFRSIRDSLLVVLAMPLATSGGVAALQALNLVRFQPLDLLTMIGFIILLGLVVNNAILLVHQTRSAERLGLDRHAAVEQALRLRLRPIFMTTSTSIIGMLPLLLVPGEGSVIYRGLAAVIVGGMSVSTLFTLILLPCFLRFGQARVEYDPNGPDGIQDAVTMQGRTATGRSTRTLDEASST